jgi:hypothetical protein
MVEIVPLAHRPTDKLDAIHGEVWIEIGHAFAGQPQGAIDNARAIIAKCLRYHSDNGHSDPRLLKTLALDAVARAHPDVF